MRKTLILVVIVNLLCGSSYITAQNNIPSNLNISILLDLSDRIDTIKYSNPSMEFYRRDLDYLKSVAKTFTNHMLTKKVIRLNDKIQLYFDPEPYNPEINELSNRLKFHITKNNASLPLFDKINKEYTTSALSIYRQALEDDEYVGSDTWGFFKNKVKDYCVEENYRNILVILTDGYVYYRDNLLNEGNFSTYITPNTIRDKGLNQSNWEEIIQTEKHGFTPLDLDLSNLEVLVLGINPSKNVNNKYDYDVLNKYWSDWLYGMGVKGENFAFKTAVLPSNMANIIDSFISE